MRLTNQLRWCCPFVLVFVSLHCLNVVTATLFSSQQNHRSCSDKHEDFHWPCTVSGSISATCSIKCKTLNPRCVAYVFDKTTRKCTITRCPTPLSLNLQDSCGCPKHQGYSLEIFYYTVRCVYMPREQMNQTEAVSMCEKRKGRLIKADTVDIMQLVTHMAFYDVRLSYDMPVWIGLDDHKKENHFRWVDGSMMTPRQWKRLFRRGQPDNMGGERQGKGQDCCVIYGLFTNDIDDYWCSGYAAAACEYIMA